MASQTVDEEIERVARRLAAAFEAREWTMVRSAGAHRFYGLGQGNHCVQVFWQDDLPLSISIGEEGSKRGTLHPQKQCSWNKEGVIQSGEGTNIDLMARGLYRLGLEHWASIEPLPPLTAHEKLELRLSLPREFWPQTWLVEKEG